MENLQLTDYLLAVVLVWLTLLSIYLFKVISNWKNLTAQGRNTNLAQILDDLVQDNQLTKEELRQIAQKTSKLELSAKEHFKKFALFRFNPFEDTGGDQSFIVALLNGENNGFVISSLHSRNGTRVYAKPISQAKATTHEFSKEEREVIEKAARQEGTAQIKGQQVEK